MDGTLVDTYQANFHAYRKAFETVGLSLSETAYANCFGLRFDSFMKRVGIEDAAMSRRIKSLKAQYYPDFFSLLRPNQVLLQFIRTFRRNGGKTAVASTARRINLIHVLGAIEAVDDFDLVLSGEDVHEGKPSPEIYEKALAYFGVSPLQTIVFEDSDVGCEAASKCRIPFIKIKMQENENRG